MYDQARQLILGDRARRTSTVMKSETTARAYSLLVVNLLKSRQPYRSVFFLLHTHIYINSTNLLKRRVNVFFGVWALYPYVTHIPLSFTHTCKLAGRKEVEREKWCNVKLNTMDCLCPWTCGLEGQLSEGQAVLGFEGELSVVKCAQSTRFVIQRWTRPPGLSGDPFRQSLLPDKGRRVCERRARGK